MAGLEYKYIVCHGSGNRFVLLDATHSAVLPAADPGALARSACRIEGGLDGLLLVVRQGEEYGMRMFNTDGSEAEMCGNGIRCVARWVWERYLPQPRFGLWSGERRYEIAHAEAIFGEIPTFGVTIPILMASDDFTPTTRAEEFVGENIPALDPQLRFTYLNLGNPHVVACVPQIDPEHLEDLGEGVKSLRSLFPNGVNVSFFRPDGEHGIYVATYERGVGLTNSCGTAMTASSTAACLLGVCGFGKQIAVRNRGGMVFCRCMREGQTLLTELVGNATYLCEGVARIDPVSGEFTPCGAARPCIDEQAEYNRFLQTLSE